MTTRSTRHIAVLAALPGLLILLWAGTRDGGGRAPAIQHAAAMPADAAPPPPRRLHSSLSMPYFSFAQSLNSRS